MITKALHFYTLLLLQFSLLLPSFGQTWQLEFHLKPMLVQHQSNYSFRDGIPAEIQSAVDIATTSFSWGCGLGVIRKLSSHFHLHFGLAYQNSNIHGLSFLDQRNLPPDRASPTYDLIINPQTKYHYLHAPTRLSFLPFNIKNSPSLTLGLSPAYLWRATYFPLAEEYRGGVLKNDFFSLMFMFSLHQRFTLSDLIDLRLGVEYSLLTPGYEDSLLFKQGPDDKGIATYGISLDHKLLAFSVGIIHDLSDLK